MNCEVRRVPKNLRYRMLTIDGEKYVLDMGPSLWKLLFPFFFWIFPNPVYKVEDPEIAEQLTAPKVRQKAKFPQLSLIGGISLLLGNLLSPLADYFDIPSPTLVNSIIVTIIVILVFILIFLISKGFKKYLYQVTDLDQLSKGRLWIRPLSFKSFFLVLWGYILFWGFAIMGIVAYIEYGNVTILLISTVFLFIAPVMPSLATIIEGHTKVKFRGGKKKKVSSQT